MPVLATRVANVAHVSFSAFPSEILGKWVVPDMVLMKNMLLITKLIGEGKTISNASVETKICKMWEEVGNYGKGSANDHLQKGQRKSEVTSEYSQTMIQ